MSTNTEIRERLRWNLARGWDIVKMHFTVVVAEEDLLRLLDQNDAVMKLHEPTPVWPLREDDRNQVDRSATPMLICLACSDDHVEADLEDSELDMSDWGIVDWPCPTAVILGGDRAEALARIEAEK